MRVLVCGGRDFYDGALLKRTLDDIVTELDVVVIHGGARGADSLASWWASTRGFSVEIYPADWNAHGSAAGPIRNQEMIDKGKPDLVVAFPGGKGTADMVRRAKAAGVLVKEV